MKNINYYKKYSVTFSIQKCVNMWVPISSAGKVFDGYIRDLGFNPRLHQKLISVLV